jgi:hypothetical protein
VADETITRDELVAFYMRDGAESESSAAGYAAEAFAWAASQREPEYEPGSAWQDARGDIYLRSSIGDWVDYSGTRHPGGFPRRPLRRLVPETAALDHGRVLEEILKWTSVRADAANLAWRICKLAGGESGG